MRRSGRLSLSAEFNKKSETPEVISDDDDYEARRAENIRKNQEMLDLLGVRELKTTVQPVLKEKRKIERISRHTLTATRKSSRLHGKAEDEDEKEKDSSDVEEVDSTEPPGDFYGMEYLNRVLEMEKVALTNSDKIKELGENETRDGPLMTAPSRTVVFNSRPKLLRQATNVAQYIIPDNSVVKVTPNRITAIYFLPTNEDIVVAGDKTGTLAIHNFKTNIQQVLHTGHETLTCISSTSPSSSTSSSSTSQSSSSLSILFSGFDGLLRRVDLATGSHSVIASQMGKDRAKGRLHSFTFASVDREFGLMGYADGSVGRFDVRENGKQHPLSFIHSKRIETIHANPRDYNYFATASADRRVAVWDMRKSELPQPKHAIWLDDAGAVMTSAYWSPSGDQLLTTSNDNKLRLYNKPHAATAYVPPSPPQKASALASLPIVTPSVPSTSHSLFCAVPHNNKTGQWLTEFKAIWHPRDPIFFCGSLRTPKVVEAFQSEVASDKPFCLLRDPFQMNTVQSLLSFHICREAFVSGGSTGRVTLWKLPSPGS